MNFTVDRDQLEGLLSRIQGVSERRHTMPVLSHALIKADSTGLTMVASDLEIVIRCNIVSANVTAEGSIALPAKKLYDIAKVLPKGDVTIATTKEGTSVRISGKSGNFRLAGLPASEFPEMPEKPTSASVGVDGELFRKLSDRVSPFASSDETRYNLAGVLLEQNDLDGKSMLRMVATDGHRLALSDAEVPGIAALLAGRKALVPRKGLIEIRKLAEAGPGAIDLSASEKFLFVGKGDTEIWVRLLEADFPDYRQVIPKGNPLSAKVPKEAFLASLKRVAVMAPEKVHSVRLSFEGNRLDVSTTSPDLGEASDALDIEYAGAPLKIGFNGKYLQEAVSGVGEDNLVIEMKDDVSQAVIRPESEPSFLAIIMPMRIF
ncbi:MAG TPA: DNA polymerase III subunit beta [Candidatus Deferrimicrobiaceae bacterium]|jgi:DNA polymerase-3 subunit beta